MSILKTMFTVLDAMVREHELLLTFANKKKELLIQGDMVGLNELVKEEAAVAHRLERLESERLAASRLVAVRLQVPPEQVTVSKMMTVTANAEEAAQLTAVTERLKNTYDELKRRNDLNKQLIQQSLSFVTTSIELLSESPQVPTYGGSGESNSPYQGGGRTSFFDSKA